MNPDVVYDWGTPARDIAACFPAYVVLTASPLNLDGDGVPVFRC